MPTLIHTADWHLGKTFHAYADSLDVQARLREERLRAIDRLGEAVRATKAAGVLVAGDVFHSHEVDDKVVVDALARIGKLSVPVVAIPGNHDHGGAGSVWERRAFAQNAQRLAPNLVLVRDAAAVVDVAGASVLAMPVRQRFDQIALADLGDLATPSGSPRIGLVHAATLTFAEDGSGRALATANADRARLDYLALGDFHRQQEVDGLACEAWYAGTFEPDAFPSHGQEGERIGAVLRLDVAAGSPVRVTPLALEGGLRWTRQRSELRDGDAVASLVGNLRAQAERAVGRVVCALDVEGSVLGHADGERFDAAVADLAPLFLSLVVRGEIAREPTEQEHEAFASRPGLVGRAAAELRARLANGGADAPALRHALLTLHQLAQRASAEGAR